jgi:hypothetical protein
LLRETETVKEKAQSFKSPIKTAQKTEDDDLKEVLAFMDTDKLYKQKIE